MPLSLSLSLSPSLLGEQFVSLFCSLCGARSCRSILFSGIPDDLSRRRGEWHPKASPGKAAAFAMQNLLWADRNGGCGWLAGSTFANAAGQSGEAGDVRRTNAKIYCKDMAKGKLQIWEINPCCRESKALNVFFSFLDRFYGRQGPCISPFY